MNYQEVRKNRSTATRRDILEAASKLIRELGFEKMTIRDVCAKAGVTTGAFYHHFSSKDELISQGFSSLDDHLEKAMTGKMELPPAQRLEALAQAYAWYVEEQGWQTMSLYYQRRLTAPSAVVISPDRFTLRTMEACFQELSQQGELSPGYTPTQLSDLCFRLFRGEVIDWILHEGGYPLLPKMIQDFNMLDTAFRP